MPRTVYTPEIKQFIADNVKGVKNKDLAAMINEKFGTNISVGGIASYKCDNGLKSGLEFMDFCRKKGDPPNRTSFKKGQTSYNKGMKGLKIPGSEKGWFEKGHKPKNWAPVGTERVRGDGYVWVKVAEPNLWQMKRRVVWEQHNGPIPRGQNIIYKDQNRLNTDISNLMPVTDAQLAMMKAKGLYTDQPELTEAGANVAKLLVGVNHANKRMKEMAGAGDGENSGV